MTNDRPNGHHVADDQDLLALILDDWHSGGTRAELTGALVDFYDDFARLLGEQTLEENIGQAIRGITAVSGCDPSPINRSLIKVDRDKDLQKIANSVHRVLRYLEQNPQKKLLPYEISIEDLNYTAFRICDLYGQVHGAPSIRDITMSESHYPEYCFSIEGNIYSYVFLYSYINYVYCSRFIKFEDVNNIIEIGPGAGRQIEVIKKIHPHLNFYLIDLGPTLYLCHQYLKAIFPDQILPYQATRDREVVRLESQGEIAFIGNWAIDRISPIGTSLSLSAAVLGLMPPMTARRYLGCIADVSDHIFMVESANNDQMAMYSLEGSACLPDFLEILGGEFLLTDREPAFYPLSMREGFGGFEMMMWTRSR